MSRINYDKKFRTAIFVICILIIVVAGLVVSSSSAFFVTTRDDSQEIDETRKHHIIITGTYDNAFYLEQVKKGAMNVSKSTDAVVELLVPASRAEDMPLQKLINYAQCVSPDGIIAYINSENDISEPIENVYGKAIPLVTLGTYTEEIPRISFIGNSYFEIGGILAREVLKILGDSGNILVIVGNNKNDPSYSLSMNGFHNVLKDYEDFSFDYLEIEQNSSVSIDDYIRQGIASRQNTDLILCLKPEDTVRASQSLIDLNRGGKVYIVGFDDGSNTREYLKKGIATSLLSYNTEKIGELAMRELFEYLRTGYANGYIMTDINVLYQDSNL